ncbi:MAG: ABC transporter substrate-binding protein [Tissierellia bacterium]|nr:ABC transporter substrate-binding protein [Tissierellia bacterium]
MGIKLLKKENQIKKIISFVMILSFFFLLACDKGMNLKVEEISQNELVDLNPVNGGEMVLPLTNMEGKNPLLTDNEEYYQFMKLVYDSLFISTPGGKYIPSLAEHYEYSNDGYTVSVTIKDNVRWQDGEPFTAYDVADTFNAIRKLPPTSAYYKLLRNAVGTCNPFNPETFARAVVFDERNVDFQFDKPYANVLEMLTFPILPSHLYDEEGMLTHENFKIMGTGPFQFNSEEENQEIILERNPNFYGKNPYIEKIHGKILNSKENMDNAFETAQIDLARSREFDWDKYDGNSRVDYEEFYTNELDFLAFNLNSPIFQGSNGKAIRQAIARGVNKKRIIESMYLNKADEAFFLLHSELYPGNLLENKIYYNMEAGKELLRNVGYKDRDEDGLLEDGDGNTIRIGVTTNSYNYIRRTIADLIIDDLRTMGIDAYPAYPPVEGEERYDENSRLEQWNTYYEALKKGDFQLALVGMNFSGTPDLGVLLYSGAIGSTNLANYSNKAMDQRIVQLSIYGLDRDEKSLYNSINDAFIDDCPYVPLYFKRGALLKDKKIKGLIHPSPYYLFRDVKDVYIPKELR